MVMVHMTSSRRREVEGGVAVGSGKESVMVHRGEGVVVEDGPS